MPDEFKYDVFLSLKKVDKPVMCEPTDKERRFISLRLDEASIKDA